MDSIAFTLIQVFEWMPLVQLAQTSIADSERISDSGSIKSRDLIRSWLSMIIWQKSKKKYPVTRGKGADAYGEKKTVSSRRKMAKP